MNKSFPPPSKIFPDLFHDLHASGLWPDGKVLSDALPLASPREIMTAYKIEKKNGQGDWQGFFNRFFQLNVSRTTHFQSDLSSPVEIHIDNLWSVLTREKDKAIPGSSLVPLPHSYIVPGGRFNEIYYWDSYFTQLGLVQSNRIATLSDMVANFAYLIDTFGFVPNGNRTYFLGRSQPPFFSLMVGLLAAVKGGFIWKQYRTQLEKEYAFWMRNASELREEGGAIDRVVMGLKDTVWNRYHDRYCTPRDEMYQTDWELAQKSEQPSSELFRHLRAACESGWDFSSRWFADPMELDSIFTSDVVPVDLNCLLFHLEDRLANAFASEDTSKQQTYTHRAALRKKSIQEDFWNEETQFFHDLNRNTFQHTPPLTLAGIYPLFFGLATKDQAHACAVRLEKEFLQPGGLVTTLHTTGQQWDAPNGWAPLQWIAVKGLRNYGYHTLANTISDRWVALNKRVYQKTGKMLEKYNVVDIGLTSGGGEYPVQDGFGWTNGVFLQLLATR